VLHLPDREGKGKRKREKEGEKTPSFTFYSLLLYANRAMKKKGEKERMKEVRPGISLHLLQLLTGFCRAVKKEKKRKKRGGGRGRTKLTATPIFIPPILSRAP